PRPSRSTRGTASAAAGCAAHRDEGRGGTAHRRWGSSPIGSGRRRTSVDTSKPAIRRRVKTGQRGRGVETSWGLPHAVVRRQDAVGGAGDGEGKVRMRSCVG